MQGDKRVLARLQSALIVKKDRRFPLIRCHEVLPPIPVDIRDGQSSCVPWFSHAERFVDIYKTTVRTGSHIEWIGIVTAEVRIGWTELGPHRWVADESIVGRPERVQFRPSVDCAFDETGRLDRFHGSVVIEICESAIPSPASTHQPQIATLLAVGSNALLKLLRLSCADKDEMPFVECEVIGDVADIDIEQSIAVNVSKIQPHTFEGVSA